MSVKVQAQVWELKLPPEHQQVLLALADHAHDDGSKCHPGVPYLAWKTGKSESAVIRTLKALKECGLITPIAYEFGGRGLATEYTINISAGTKKLPYTRKGVILPPFSDGGEKGSAGASVSPVKGGMDASVSEPKGGVNATLSDEKGGVCDPERVAFGSEKGSAGATPTGLRNRVTEPVVQNIFSPVVDECEREGANAPPRPRSKSHEKFAPLVDAFLGRGLPAPLLINGEAKAAATLLGVAPPAEIAECWQDLASGCWQPSSDFWERDHLSFAVIGSQNRLGNWRSWKQAGKKPREERGTNGTGRRENGTRGGSEAVDADGDGPRYGADGRPERDYYAENAEEFAERERLFSAGLAGAPPPPGGATSAGPA